MSARDLLMLFALAALWGASYLFIRIGAPALGPFPLAAGRTALASLGWSPIAPTGAVLASVAAMLVASAAYAVSGVYAKQRLAGVPAATLAIGQQLGAVVWLAPPALWRLPAAEPAPGALLALVALAVLCTALAYPLYFRLIASAGPTKTTTVTYLIPLFGMLWGVVFLGEAVTRGMVAGLACILASIVLVNEVGLRGRAAVREAREAAAPTAGAPRPGLTRS